ncbi:MAG: chorismate pyruvate-lyase family protein [Candidatus Poribacteria bacterium]|nr:chorismate pyruvate-lyase family protein [Candidatus Poribacteria bacterium]
MKTNTPDQPETFVNTRMKSLFVAQDKKPATLRKINLARLTPFQRGLLVMDGTVTRFIEAYTFAPVKVVLLQQKKQILSTEHPWLQLPAGEEVISRQVILQTPVQKKLAPIIHTYADSLIVSKRLPRSILDGLESNTQGLGTLLQHSGLETRRELLWCGIETLIDLPPAIAHLEGDSFISRTYLVLTNQEPLILINEKFPFE